MRIERPVFLLADRNRDETYPTVGTFYDSIRAAIRPNAPALGAAVASGGAANQVGSNIGITTISPTGDIDPVDQLLDGLDLIVEQGEGASSRTLFGGRESDDEVSHYARFATLFYGAGYADPPEHKELTIETEPDYFKGHPVRWPRVINTLAVPTDGYRRLLELDPNGAAVSAGLGAFDAGYVNVLTALDAVWNGPAHDARKRLGGAVAAMVGLGPLSSFNIMSHQVPSRLVGRLPELYPDEFEYLQQHTDLAADVFYGPRFETRTRQPT
jgi:hypothetical protein